DSPRVKPGAAQQALDDLRWLGLDWDGDPLVQTERLPVYEAALARLQAAELVYPCTCTRADVERAASAPHLDQEGPVYPGTCAGRRAADALGRGLPALGRGLMTTPQGDVPYCWRFRLPRETPEFTDLFRGPQRLDLHALGGDFVVWKAPRPPNT